MKSFFNLCFTCVALLLLGSHAANAQCVDGSTTNNVAYDTTISFPSGVTNMQVKFPKFNPEEGMLTCMRMCITIGGIIDTLAFENRDISASQNFNVSFARNDFLSGPGITGVLMSNFNRNYNFNLAPDDGNPKSGPDFAQVTKDTISGTQSCTIISTESDLNQFYSGMPNDSVSYTYMINGGITFSSSPNVNMTMLTSGFVRIAFQYCTCPSASLPFNARYFNAKKTDVSKAQLTWTGFDDNNDYYYEAQVSSNGRDFTTLDKVQKNMSNANYRLPFTATQGGTYYFRLRQVYANGYVRFSQIRQVDLEKSTFTKFSFLPNPSSGNIGIKFATIMTAPLQIVVYNVQGQTLINKKLKVNDLSYLQVGSLSQPGVYWVKVIDEQTGEFGVQQLIIK